MDELALLCETCGYELKGLEDSRTCPECGRLIFDSQPNHRLGSPWQRSPGLFSWARTLWQTLRRPRLTFSQVHIDARWAALLIANLVLAATIFVAPLWGTFVGDPARHARRESGLGAMAIQVAAAVVEILMIAGVLFILTWIEYAGIRFFSRRRRWRLTRAAAWQVCAHASFGWMFCGIFVGFALAALFSVQRLFGLAPTGRVDLRSMGIQFNEDWYVILGIGGPLLACFAGVVIFEVLVYKGVRACRYAATAPAPIRT
ncbi:hypothetical protein PHYC_02758 [Phycisphaerales bacterium]|nr:hypothetical protein PHYC_02758 [Phycisphaerales bacterium]